MHFIIVEFTALRGICLEQASHLRDQNASACIGVTDLLLHSGRKASHILHT
jgi:hypothetical protein